MKIIIAGGTGYIGSALTQHLKQKHQVVVVSRDPDRAVAKLGTDIRAISWNKFDRLIDNTDAVLNLCGEGIANTRWTSNVKQRLRDSRLMPTTTIAQYCQQHGARLINASAISHYGIQTTDDKLPPIATEQDSCATPKLFSAKLVHDWEHAALQAGPNTVLMRLGVVLSGNGGLLSKMLLPFKLGLGGKLGSGEQPFSWIHMADVIAAIDFFLQNPQHTGPFNLTAPHYVTQHEFAKTLAADLHRPCFTHTPAWLLRLMLGELADELILNGRQVAPEKLLQAGFKFNYPKLPAALQALR